METIQRQAQEEQFSERVSKDMSDTVRQSTASVYESRWRQYCCWCDRGQIDYVRPSVTNLADFFDFLFYEKKLSSSCILGYRSAISPLVQAHLGARIRDVPRLQALLRHYVLARPRVAGLRKPPDWDLLEVLRALRRPPFEPMANISLQHLTWKTVFLLALASGRRRSELSALSFEDGCTQWGNQVVYLKTRVGFMAKRVIANRDRSVISIPALSQLVGTHQEAREERFLCPLRALKWYKQRTSESRRADKHMFMCYKEGLQHVPASPATISRWIVETVRFSLRTIVKKGGIPFLKVRAHEVRALASSLSYLSGTDWEQLLSAGYWKAQDTFINFYLCDLQIQESNLFRLGPLVVGQQIMAGRQPYCRQ